MLHLQSCANVPGHCCQGQLLRLSATACTSVSALTYWHCLFVPQPPACCISHTTGGGEEAGQKGREGETAVMHSTETLGLLSAALVFPIGFDSTGAPFALQLSAPAGMDGFLMGLGLALEKLFGPMPAPPSTAACSGCSSNVFYTNVSSTHPCFAPKCKSLHSQCTNLKPILLSFHMESRLAIHYGPKQAVHPNTPIPQYQLHCLLLPALVRVPTPCAPM